MKTRLSALLGRSALLTARPMLCARHTPRHHQSTARIAAMLLAWCVIGASVAHAQPAEVSPKEAMASYQTVNQWVRGWNIEPESDASTMHGPYAVVAVTIRVDGKVLGRSTLGSITPDAQLLWRTTRQAMHRAGVHLPTDRDAGWEEDRAEMIASMTLCVELARSLVPIPKSELGTPDFGLTPASMGIAVRSGDRIEPMAIDAMLMQGMDPVEVVGSLAVTLSGDGATALQSIDELIATGGMLYRFEQVTLAQPRVRWGAEFLDRGGRVVSSSEITTRELRRMGAGIAGHLRVRRWTGIERFGVMGTLNPVTGKHEQGTASPFEQSMAALALLRYGALGEDGSHQRARLSGRDILRDLSVVEPGESAVTDDFVATAACVAALSHIDRAVIESIDELETLHNQTIDTMRRAYSVRSGFDASIPNSARGLVSWAMVRGSAVDSRIDRADAVAAVRAVFREVPAAQLVAQMPFLGWAETEAAEDGPIPAGAALEEMRTMVYDHMLRPADLDRVDRDLVGGIVFTSSSAPLPSWHSLRPLAFIATMLGDERFTPGTARSGQVPRQISELVQSLRFVRQLAATEPATHMYARPDRAQWGIRASLWDQRMTIESSAMGLLMVSETLRSLDELTQRSQPMPEREENLDSE